MDKWDEEKLRSVILSKHGNPQTTTDVSSELPLRVSPNPLRLFFPSRSYASTSLRLSRHKSEGHPLIYIKRSVSHTHCSRFGWFWQCPNGDSCQYRHALPPGFVLKSQKKAMEEAEKANQISLEEFLEVEVCPMFVLARPSVHRT